MEKLVIKKYVLQITPCGGIMRTIDLDELAANEKEKILSKVFAQGLQRMGYEQIK